MMTKCQTPVFLARERSDADDLVEQFHEARVDAEIGEVLVGEDRRGWQVLVAAADAERARSIATLLEVQRYGNWESRGSTEAHWGVMEDDSDLRDPTEIYSAQSVVQAHLLKNLLADQGITAIVTNQMLHGGAGIDLIGTPTAAKVVVAAEDAAAAREFALDFDDRTYERAGWPGGDPTGPDSSPWPTCPGCDAKRTTRCPICETSGTDFTEADRGDALVRVRRRRSLLRRRVVARERELATSR
jgi:putative signal transducing protein